jgi:hypothetical protein
MQRATANTQKRPPQGEFTLRVKTALLRRHMSVSDLARDLGLSRNTVSLAINRGLYAPTRKRIAKHLSLS